MCWTGAAGTGTRSFQARGGAPRWEPAAAGGAPDVAGETMQSRILAAEALLGPDYTPAGPTEIVIEAGRIAAVSPAPPGAACGGLALPAPVNAHDHARPLSPTSFGLGGEPLETWLPGLGAMPSVDAGLAARAAFARAARGGVAASMVHLTRPMGLLPLAEEAVQIADAAEAVGIRIALAISLRDRNPLVYGDHGPVLDDVTGADAEAAARLEAALDRPMPPTEVQIAQVEAVAAALEGRGIDVQFGPTGPQWCSPELLSAIAEASSRSGRRIHMHLLETKYQRDWANRTHPDGLLPWLDAMGFLSPRLSLAHCTWARPEELALIAAREAQVVVNTSSNLHLKSGLAPVGAMCAAGVPMAMGLDGCAFDEDDDALRELRLMKALHAGTGFDDVLSPQRALSAACGTGRQVLGLEAGGVLAPGMPADILLLDETALDRDALLPIDPRVLLFARGRKEAIRALWVAGRPVMQEGRPTGLDAEAAEEALRAAFRAAMPATDAHRAAWPVTRQAVARWYRDRVGCC